MGLILPLIDGWWLVVGGLMLSAKASSNSNRQQVDNYSTVCSMTIINQQHTHTWGLSINHFLQYAKDWIYRRNRRITSSFSSLLLLLIFYLFYLKKKRKELLSSVLIRSQRPQEGKKKQRQTASVSEMAFCCEPAVVGVCKQSNKKRGLVGRFLSISYTDRKKKKQKEK